jgi:hypothetical protein
LGIANRNAVLRGANTERGAKTEQGTNTERGVNTERKTLPDK